MCVPGHVVLVSAGVFLFCGAKKQTNTILRSNSAPNVGGSAVILRFPLEQLATC